MCRQCELRKINADDDLEASALLQMLMNKMHARPVEDDGAMQIAINLSGQEADWLCAWGASNEDMEDCDPAEDDDAAEDDDPTEEDTPPEASEQLDTDCRLESYKPIEVKPTRRIRSSKARSPASLFEIGDRVVVEVEIDMEAVEIVGTIQARSETEEGIKYTIQPEGLPEARIEVEARHVFPAIAA